MHSQCSRIVALFAIVFMMLPEPLGANDEFCSGVVSSSGQTWQVRHFSRKAITTRELHDRIIVITPHAVNTASQDCPDRISIQTSMPGHGHGMQTEPTVEKMQNCSFLVQGNHWHMPGLWRQTIVLTSGHLTESAVIDIDLPLTGCK